MDIAGDREGEGADVRPLQHAARKQGRLGMRLIQPLADSDGLGQHGRAIVQFQRRHQPLRVQAPVVRRALLRFAQMVESMLYRDALEVKGDPNTPGGGGSVISVKAHGGTLFTLSGRRARRSPPPAPAGGDYKRPSRAC
jgi:hypothetical protein